MPQKIRETGIYGTGFNNARGGFERIIIDGVSFDEAEIRRRVSTQPDLLAGAKDLFEKLPEAAMLGAKLRLAISKAEGR